MSRCPYCLLPGVSRLRPLHETCRGSDPALTVAVDRLRLLALLEELDRLESGAPDATAAQLRARVWMVSGALRDLGPIRMGGTP